MFGLAAAKALLSIAHEWFDFVAATTAEGDDLAGSSELEVGSALESLHQVRVRDSRIHQFSSFNVCHFCILVGNEAFGLHSCVVIFSGDQSAGTPASDSPDWTSLVELFDLWK